MSMMGPDLTGVTLNGRYYLVQQIGHGGFATVYEAIDQSIDKRVAVKVLSPKYAVSEEFRRRFVQEAREAARVRHRLLVDVSDQGSTADGTLFFVMELLQGVSLGDRIRDRPGPMHWRHVVAIAAELARALEVAHSHGIVHRDVKPGNIFLVEVPGQGEDLQLKLLDLGIAKVQRSEVNLDAPETRASQGAPGTPEYMAPEQFHGLGGEVQNGPSIDLYAVGVLMYRLLTGTLPFTAKTPYGVLTKHSTEVPMPLRRRCPEAAIPVEVEAVVLRLMEKHPADRFASARELRGVLQELLRADAREQVRPPRRGLGEHTLLRSIRYLFTVATAGICCMLLTLCTISSGAPASSHGVVMAPTTAVDEPAPPVRDVIAPPPIAAAPTPAPIVEAKREEAVESGDEVVLIDDDEEKEKEKDKVEAQPPVEREKRPGTNEAKKGMSAAAAEKALKRQVDALAKKIPGKCKANLVIPDTLHVEVTVDRSSDRVMVGIKGGTNSERHRECALKALEGATYKLSGAGTVTVTAKVVIS